MIVVPHGNSAEKNAAMRGFGAELIEHGRDFQEAREHASTIAPSAAASSCRPFHRDLALRRRHLRAELFAAVPDLDAVYVPIGMGSGICSLLTVRDLLGLDAEIVGVVSEEAPSIALSFAARQAVATESAATFADGVACREPDPEAIAIMLAGGARILTVSDGRDRRGHAYAAPHDAQHGRARRRDRARRPRLRARAARRSARRDRR